MDILKPKPADDLEELRTRVADFKKQSQLLLERFQRGEISQADAQAEARRIEEAVLEADRRVHELELQRKSANRIRFTPRS